MIISAPKIVIGLFLIGTGAAFTYAIFADAIDRMRAARHWVQTPCTIVASELDASTHNARTRSGGKQRRTDFIERITYIYQIAGRDYESKKTSFRSGKTGRWAKEHWTQRYPQGALTTCYVNPHDPHQAVLRRGFTLDMIYGFIPLGFGALLGLPLLATAIKRISRQKLQNRIAIYRHP